MTSSTDSARPRATPGPDETLDRLSNTLRILQRRKGHRATSDDVLLAGVAAEVGPAAGRVLDLGTGKGTVALLLARRLPRARIVGVEAFAQSHALALRNAALNGLAGRFDPRLGDLRDPSVLAREAPFDLVTGAPPFMPPGTGVMPRDEQRAAGRFELRGGIEDYALTAARHLARDGAAVLLMDGRSRQRTEAALVGAGLHLRLLTAIVPRPARPPTFWVAVAGLRHEGPPTIGVLAMRGLEGSAWSPRYAALRAALDLDAAASDTLPTRAPGESTPRP